jgi:hypothetical protein
MDNEWDAEQEKIHSYKLKTSDVDAAIPSTATSGRERLHCQKRLPVIPIQVLWDITCVNKYHDSNSFTYSRRSFISSRFARFRLCQVKLA